MDYRRRGLDWNYGFSSFSFLISNPSSPPSSSSSILCKSRLKSGAFEGFYLLLFHRWWGPPTGSPGDWSRKLKFRYGPLRRENGLFRTGLGRYEKKLPYAVTRTPLSFSYFIVVVFSRDFLVWSMGQFLDGKIFFLRKMIRVHGPFVTCIPPQRRRLDFVLCDSLITIFFFSNFFIAF